MYRSSCDNRGHLDSASTTRSNSARSASAGRALRSRGMITDKGVIPPNSLGSLDHTAILNHGQCVSERRVERAPATGLIRICAFRTPLTGKWIVPISPRYGQVSGNYRPPDFRRTLPCFYPLARTCSESWRCPPRMFPRVPEARDTSLEPCNRS